MKRCWLVVMGVMALASACSESTPVDLPAAEPVPSAVVESAQASPSPTAEPTAPAAATDPDDDAFRAPPELNALGDPMVLTLVPVRPIATGTRVSDLLARPSRYFTIQPIDPSDRNNGNTDFAADTATYAWLLGRPDHIVSRDLDEDDWVVWKSQFAEEEFVDVLVAAGRIRNGMPITKVMEDFEGWTNVEQRPAWVAERERWISSRRSPITIEDVAFFQECRIRGNLSKGDPIEVDLPWAGFLQVLLVVDEIPAGLTVDELVIHPTRYLSARVDSGCGPRTMSSVAELRELAGQVALRDIEAGERLDASQFGEPAQLPDGVTPLPTPTPPPAPTPRPLSDEVYVAVQDLPVGLTMVEVLQDPEAYLVVAEIELSAKVDGAIGPRHGDVRDGEPYGMLAFALSRCALAQPIAAGEQLILSVTTLQRVWLSRAAAPGTTVGEIVQNSFNRDGNGPTVYSTADICAVEDADFLVDLDQFNDLDQTLVLNRVVSPDEPLQFSFFSEPE